MSDIKVGITLTADSRGLVGGVKTSTEELGKFKKDAVDAGASAAKSFYEAQQAAGRLSDAQRQYSSNQSAYAALNMRGSREVAREIQLVQAAYNRLATSGTISQQELARASVVSRNRITELNNELRGMPASGGAAVDAVTGRVMALAAAWLSLHGLMRAADSVDIYSGVNARLQLASKSTSEFSSAQSALAAIATDTRSDWEATVNLYSKMATSTKDLNIAQSDLLIVTKALNQAGIVSGATSAEQAAALQQLGQALSAGTLRGDELNSVLEQMPRVGQLIADGLGVPFGKLRELAAQGKLTTEQVIASIRDQSGTIQAEFDRMPVSVGQAMGQIHNEMLKLIGDQATATGGANALAGGLLGVADAIKYLPQYLPEIATGLAAVGAQALVARAGLAVATISMATMTAGAMALAKALLPLAAAEGSLKIWELGTTILGAYDAKQVAAAASTRQTQAAYEAWGKTILPNAEKLRQLGINIESLDPARPQDVVKALRALSADARASAAATAEMAAANDDAAASQVALAKEVVDYLSPLRERLRLAQFTGRELQVQTALSRAHAQGINDQDSEIRRLITSTYDLSAARRASADQARTQAQEQKSRAAGVNQADNGADQFVQRLSAVNPFERIAQQYQQHWQKMVAIHGDGSAKVKRLETAYASWVDRQQAAKESKQQKADEKVISLQAAKYARLKQSAAESMATDADRAKMRLDADLQTMADERQRLVDQHLWTADLESKYEQARIDRAQTTALEIERIKSESSARKAQAITDYYSQSQTMQQTFSQMFQDGQLVNLRAMKDNVVDFASSSLALWKKGEEGKLHVTSGVLGMMSGLMASKSRAMFETGKAAARGENAINTYLGATKAYQSMASIPFIGPVLGAAAAVAVVAAGVSNDQKISSAQFGGSTSGGASVSAPSVSSGATPTYQSSPSTGLPVQQQAPQQQQAAPQPIHMYVNGVVSMDQLVNQMAPDALKARINNGDFVLINQGSAQHSILTGNG